MPLFNEVINQKSYNGLETTYLSINQIKCPYCRYITNKLMPYIPMYINNRTGEKIPLFINKKGNLSYRDKKGIVKPAKNCNDVDIIDALRNPVIAPSSHRVSVHSVGKPISLKTTAHGNKKTTSTSNIIKIKAIM